MPEFILYLAMSLDGYIARTDGRVDWLPTSENDDDDYGYEEFYSSVDALVMGATTYEQVLGFGEWPYVGKPSYVLTHRNLSTNRNNVTIANQGLDALMEAIQQATYQRVWIMGGSQIVSAFMTRGWIDRHIIAIVPRLLGAGIPLYEAVPEQPLTLIDTKVYPSGVVVLNYCRVS
jgi:dihydrofolate reductase